MNNSAAPVEHPMLIDDDDDDDDDIMLVEDDLTVTKTTRIESKEGMSRESLNRRHTAETQRVNKQSSSLSSSSSSSHSRDGMIKDINTYISQVKTASKKTEDEVELMRRSLRSMETSLGDAVYAELKFLVDNPGCLVNLPVDKHQLELMIQEIIKDVFTPDLLEMTTMETQSICRRLDTIESANHTVSKMFLECHSKLKAFGLCLAEESKRINEEISHYEKILSHKTINIDDDDEDDDDDVKIVDETSPAQSCPQQTGSSHSLHGMNMGQLRSRFASAVQTQMPGLLSTLNHQQAQAASKISTLPTPSSSSSSSTPSCSNSNDNTNSTSALTSLMAGHPSDKAVVWPTLQVNDKVMGKKFNDVWYPGTILDIYPPSPPQEPQWRCKVRFNKGLKVIPGKHVAYKESLKCVVRVGTRVIALYKEEDAPNTMFAGIIAEAPSMKNNKRFLVFFDDGYAQYCHAHEVHKVYMQSENVWEDIHPETRSFIKDYLDIYPERPMVRLAKGQVVKTEWNGKWWMAKVIELDASLVKMLFQADKRTEWIYRGSTRLEPLFRALTNANAIKAAGSSRGRRLNLTMKPSDVYKKPAVEYTRGNSLDEDVTSGGSKAKDKEEAGKGAAKVSKQATAAAETKKKSNVARKSTGGSTTQQGAKNSVPEKWEAPWIKYQRRASSGTGPPRTPASDQKQDTASQDTGSGRTNRAVQSRHGQAALESLKKSQDIASVLQERLAQASDQVEYDEHVETGKRRDITIDTKGKTRSHFEPHQCSPVCIGEMEEVLDDPQKMKGTSPLLIPLMCFWERQVCKARPNPKRFVVYRGPCGRRLRSLGEVDRYLHLTNSNLGIDLFSYDHNLHVSREFVPIKTFCDIKDLSYGIENYPISCVNGVDRHYPDYVEYYNYRIPAKGVNLNLNPDFLACCDCTDNCRDRSKCACQQLTIQNTSCIGSVDTEAGYHYRRLREPLFTGIFECNANCPCDKRCHNKVAQLGLRMRLQVFRTEKKGWGLRCLDDIAKGSFICIYAGQLLTDRGANEDGKQYGDEYLAELDFMEVVEGQKEGYESDIEFFDDEKDQNYETGKESDDSDYSSGSVPVSNVGGERRRSLRRNTKAKEKGKDLAKESQKSKTGTKSMSRSGSVEAPSTPISISDDDEDAEESKEVPMETDGNKKSKIDGPAKTEVRRRAKKSTGGSRLNLSYSAVNKSSEPEQSDNPKNKKSERLPTRSFFHDDTECYIMDAKSMGNLGRYLNHSCSPNVFVQNVFVDTHDLRFPWVAFFAGEYIRAGTELTWDYNYEVGSVPDKILYCYCGSSMCRGRLL